MKHDEENSEILVADGDEGHGTYHLHLWAAYEQ